MKYTLAIVLVVSIASLLFLNPVKAVTIQLQDADTENLEDARVDNLSVNSNYGSETVLNVDNHINNDERSYIKFGISFIPADKLITNATLFLYFYADAMEALEIYNVSVHQVYQVANWIESSVSWNTQPCAKWFNNATACNLTGNSEAQVLDGVFGWVSFDVTNFINESYLAGNVNSSFAIRYTTEEVGAGSDLASFYSKEYATAGSRPYLNITYSGILPAITVTNPTNTTYSEFSVPIEVTNTTKVETIWYSLNGGANVIYTTPLNINALSGPNNITISANNSDGDSVSETIYFTVTIPAPAITVVSPENTTYSSTSVQLNVMNSSKIDTFWYILNDGSNQTFQPNTTVSASEGPNKLIVYGNNSIDEKTSETIYFTVVLPLSITVLSPLNVTYHSNPIIALNVTNSSKVETFRYSLNGGAWVVFTPNTTINATGYYNIYITIQANTSEGNLTSETVYFTYDSMDVIYSFPSFWTMTFVVPAAVQNITLQATSCYKEQEIWVRANIVCSEPSDCVEGSTPATLNIPAGFSIVNDVNIHSNPVIPYAHYWATEWVIRCPSTTGSYPINISIPGDFKETTIVVNHKPMNPVLTVKGTEYYGNDAGIVYAQILDEDGTPVNVANCSATIYYPNQTVWVNYVDMPYLTQSHGFYYYNFVAPATEGVYGIQANCSGPTAYGMSTFHINTPLNETIIINASAIAEEVWNYPSGQGSQTMKDFLVNGIIWIMFGGAE